MSGHLCLKWNNHSTAFLTSINNIHIKGRFCDATLACQGKFFPVHRFILSTCSDYFDALFERMQSTHPYIVFKDIEPEEIELLLHYMYQGEVNVVQEDLPKLIRAAEALQIKGLAVPDEAVSKKDNFPSRKRSSWNSLETPAKRRAEENMSNEQKEDTRSESESIIHKLCDQKLEPMEIKEEPVESNEFRDDSQSTGHRAQSNKPEGMMHVPETTLQEGDCGDGAFQRLSCLDDLSVFSKTSGSISTDNHLEKQASSWNQAASGSLMTDFPILEMTSDDVMHDSQNSRATGESMLGRCIEDGCSVFRKVATQNTPPSHTYRCPCCDYRSSWRNNVKKHMYIHTGERPHPCTICSKRFKLKHQLQSHLRTHSKDTNQQQQQLQPRQQEESINRCSTSVDH